MTAAVWVAVRAALLAVAPLLEARAVAVAVAKVMEIAMVVVVVMTMSAVLEAAMPLEAVTGTRLARMVLMVGAMMTLMLVGETGLAAHEIEPRCAACWVRAGHCNSDPSTSKAA